MLVFFLFIFNGRPNRDRHKEEALVWSLPGVRGEVSDNVAAADFGVHKFQDDTVSVFLFSVPSGAATLFLARRDLRLSRA